MRAGLEGSIVRLGLALLVLALLAACAPKRSAVVRPAGGDARPSAPARAGDARQYTVQRGDTLYGIAFRHGLDYRDVARANGIAAPYTIYPGQRLRLGAAGPAPAVRATAPAAAPPSGRGVVASTVRDTPAPAATTPPASAQARPAPSAPATSPSASTVPATPAASTPAPATTAAGGTPVWRWPASGPLVGRFVAGDPTRQGIDIAGTAGQPVLAAAAGDVVYSGAGLVGYGELIIIKHTDTWLSAYGHNRKRLVEEGQRVAAGQQIAEMGRSGASRDMLHFEIRRNGKPVDPLPLLPKP